MSAMIGTRPGPIVLAIAFDDQTFKVVDDAIGLAKALGRELRIIHAFDEQFADPVVAEMPGYYQVPSLLTLNFEKLLGERRQKMAELLQQVGARHAVTGQVIVGETARVILADADARLAPLVITACSPGSYDFVPAGFSTAMTLMVESKLPVLTINDTRRLQVAKDKLRILVCDDLTPTSAMAVKTAYKLATALPGASVKHLHVHGDFRELLKSSWSDLLAKTPGISETFATPEELWTKQNDERTSLLKRRAAPYRDQLVAAGGQANIEVRLANKVESELRLVDEEWAPHLIVFGRHRLLKTRPFVLGRVPYRAMLGLNRAVLMVPPEAGLDEVPIFP